MEGYRFSLTSERKEAKEMFLEGFTYLEIGEKLKRNHTTIYKWKRSERWGNRVRNIKKRKEAEKLIAGGTSVTKAAKAVGVARGTLYTWGLSKRGLYGQNQDQNKGS